MRALALLAVGLVACVEAVQPRPVPPTPAVDETANEEEKPATPAGEPPTPAAVPSSAPTAQPMVADPWEPKEAPKRFEDPWAAGGTDARLAWVSEHCSLSQPESYLSQPVCNPVCPPKVRIWPCAEYKCPAGAKAEWVTLANQHVCAIARGTQGRAARVAEPPPVDRPRTLPRSFSLY